MCRPPLCRSAQGGRRSGSVLHPYLYPDSRRPVCRRRDVPDRRLGRGDGSRLGRPDTGGGNLALGRLGREDESLALGRPGRKDENLGLGRPGREDENLALGRPDTEDESLGLGRPGREDENLALGRPDTEDESLGLGRPDTEDENLALARLGMPGDCPDREGESPGSVRLDRGGESHPYGVRCGFQAAA